MGFQNYRNLKTCDELKNFKLNSQRKKNELSGEGETILEYLFVFVSRRWYRSKHEKFVGILGRSGSGCITVG